MTERPTGTTIDRLLAEEAERAVPDDLDLWPSIAARLRALSLSPAAPDALPRSRLIESAQPPDGESDPGRPFPRHASRPWRGGGSIGSAATLGLMALAILLFAATFDRWERGGRPAAVGSVASPRPGVLCDIDLDVGLSSGRTEDVVVSVRARAASGCPRPENLRLELVDAAGKRATIFGNPIGLPVASGARESQVDRSVIWANWCGASDRFQIKTTFSDETVLLPLPSAPRCLDPARRSTIRLGNASTPVAASRSE